MLDFTTTGGVGNEAFIIIGNRLEDQGSNPGWDFAFHSVLMPLGKA